MTLSALLIFAATLFAAAGSPGPSVAALVSRVLAKGFRDVLPFLAAMWIGEAIWLSCAVFGLSLIAERLGAVFIVLRYAGACYLIYLAFKMWTAPIELGGDDLPAARNPWRMFLTGMAITLGNPKIMVFYLALVPTLIDLSAVDLFSWGELVGVMLAVLIAVDLFWAALAWRARTLLKSRRAVKYANRTGAAVMAGSAAIIAGA